MKIGKVPIVKQKISIKKSGGITNVLRPEFRKADRPVVIKHILIVDDYESMLSLFQNILWKAPFEVDLINPHAFIPAQIEKRVADKEYCAVLMDGDLRETTGEKMVRMLRDDGFTGMIFAMSGRPDFNEDMLRAGADFALPDKMPQSFVALFEAGK
jgi:CheY-like chemotaxis protein